MSDYTATVFKSGNSYALRVPKDYIVSQGLRQGQKVKIGAAQKLSHQDHEAVIAALRQLQKLQPFKDVDDPVRWQRETRQDRKLPFRD